MKPSEKRTVYVVSAPSGTGKTTLNRRLIHNHPHLAISISLTTRKQRPNETPGVDYHFVSMAEFEKTVQSGQMLESALVHGNYYGTSKVEIERIFNAGETPLLEIDVQGWLQAKPQLTDAVSVFILPPSLANLWERLEKRGTDSLETRWKRLSEARTEIGVAHNYDHFIINDQLDAAYHELEGLIVHGRPCRLPAAKGRAHCQHLLQEFDTAPWIKDLAAKLGASS